MTTLLPVLLGADLNCYHLARSFYTAYQVKSVAFAKEALSQTRGSRFLSVHVEKEIEKPEVLLKILLDYARKTPDRTKLLLGCTDGYVQAIASLAKELEKDYIVPYPPKGQLLRFSDKSTFASLCQGYGIPTPPSVLRHPFTPLPPLSFPYPIILKPTQSDRYWKHPFANMQKVYLCCNQAQAEEVLSDIDASGYDGCILAQPYLYGSDCTSYVLHGYSDRRGRVRCMAYGQVLCEEHTPRGRGNPAGIFTRECDELCEKLKTLMEKEHWVGFFNFDIKEDAHTNTRYVLECNPRQGRCSFFAEAGGCSLSETVVGDRFFHHPYTGVQVARANYFWTYLPVRLVYRQLRKQGAEGRALLSACKQAKRAGRYLHSYDCAEKDPKRRFWLWAHKIRHYQKSHRYRPLCEVSKQSKH